MKCLILLTFLAIWYIILASVEKHSYGLGLIVTKLEETQLTSKALSVFTANLFKMQRRILCTLLSLLRGFPEEVSGKLVIVA